jgi:hypothetical protein
MRGRNNNRAAGGAVIRVSIPIAIASTIFNAVRVAVANQRGQYTLFVPVWQ